MTYDFSNPSYTRHVLYLKSIFLSEPVNISAVSGLEQTSLQRKSGIYVILNTKTGDYYVGSSVDTRKRKTSHWWAMANGGNGNLLLKKHADRYGIDVFKFLFIQSVKPEDLIEAETFWIGSLSPFYNQTKMARRPEMTDARRAATANISKNIRNNNVYKVPVVQLSKDGEFIRNWDSVKEATIGVGAKGGHISKACANGLTAFGFKWQYKNGLSTRKPRYKQ